MQMYLRPIDSSTSTSMTISFSKRQRAQASELESFWQENEIAVVILL